jgi:peptide/nickel transport system substrate-binding protein
VYKTIPEDSTAIAALETGQVDVLQDPPFKDLKRFSADAKYRVYRASAANCQLITINNLSPMMTDKRVRKAISLGINRQEIVDTVWYGYADVAGDFFPLNHWAHDPSLDQVYSVDKAKALLAEAGYTAAKPLEFTMIPLNEAPMMDAAALIQTQLAKVGIKMNIRPMEYTAVSAMTVKPQAEWTGDAVLQRITPLRGTAYEFTYYQYGADAGGALNYERYNRTPGAMNEAAETLMKSLNSYSDFIEADRVKAKPLYKQLSQYVIEDEPRIRLVWWNNADIASAQVMDWVPAEGDVNLLNKTWLNR